MSKVKLVMYEHQKETTYIEDIEAESWEDFLIVRVTNFKDVDLQSMALTLKEGAPEKKIFIVSSDSDVAFYGVKEDDES